jgi:eukaryotic-like serine/threonine-protein kinase
MLELGLDSTEDNETSSERQATGEPAPAYLPGAFGAYRPIAILGEGGMGIVYLAEQDQPIRRHVALKVIKLGMDTRHVIARFESERQALALMDHPNIAHVYDAGATTDGRPYFAMEYVPGTPITEYCDKHVLGPRERLQLFIQVCHAVHHAHQKGVIHRDIKPSNILVMMRDGKPVPKIIDFGVAKATDRRLTEKTLFTDLGVMIGTPAYMSPEQAKMTGLDVDTATDIYSLGVVLYELLVGALPFDPHALRKAGYEEIGRIIREDEPPRPTMRLHRLGPTATEIARRRHMDVRALARVVRGDLDWITMKALEKDRARRYPSASEFAADITRHLCDEVVLARPPRLGYRASRFVRKHRAAVAAAVGFFLILTVGSIVSTIFFFTAEAARRDADRQRRTAERQSDLANTAAGEADAARRDAERHRESAEHQSDLANIAAAEAEAARRDADRDRDSAERQSYLANIAAADRNLESGATTEARRRLEQIAPALRGWEWRHLYLRSDTSVAALGAAGAVRSVVFSPDQSRIFWISEYGVVHAADAVTHRRLPELTQPTPPLTTSSQPVYVVAMAPGGSRLLSSAWESMGTAIGRGVLPVFGLVAHHRPLSGDDTNTLSLSDALSGEQIRHFAVPNMGTWTMLSAVIARTRGRAFSIHRDGITDGTGSALATMSGGGEPVSATFSPDGRLLATWAWDNVLRIWDVESGAAVAALAGHDDGISSAAFSRDGARVVSGSYDGTARIWKLRGGETTVLTGHQGAVNAVAFAPDGLRVASGGSDKVVRVWDVSGRSLGTLTGHDGRITALAFAPTGPELVSGSEDRTIRLWDATTFSAGARLNGHTDTIISIAISADGRQIVSGSTDQTLRFWEPDARRSDGIVASTGGNVWQVAVSRDSSRLAVSQHDGAVRVLSLVTASTPIICTREPFPNFFSHKNVAFTPDGTRLVSTYSGPDGPIRVWDPSNCKMLAGWPGNRNEAPELAMSPDGRRFAAGQWGTLQVWDLSTSKSIWQTNQAGKVRAVAYTPDGTRIVATADRDIRVWNADRPAVALTMTGHEDDVTALSVSPDGRWIASGSNDRTVRLWSVATGRLAAVLVGHNASVGAVAFSPDSARLVSGGGDHTLRLWDVATQEPILVLQGHEANVTAVAFTPDGTRIVSGSADGTVRVWDSRLSRTPGTESPDTPSELNAKSWRVVKSARRAPDAYQAALRQALLANESAPWHLPFVQTLGAAYYRVRQYDASLSTLARAAQLRPPAAMGVRGVEAYDLAFTAMAHHQLGHGGEARAALDQLGATSADADLQALIAEVSALILGR